MAMHAILKMALVPVVMHMLAGCASNIPEPIRNEPVAGTDLATVRNQINTHIGDTVRWGGSIVAVENRSDSTWIEVVASELNHYGMPAAPDEDAGGRFIPRI